MQSVIYVLKAGKVRKMFDIIMGIVALVLGMAGLTIGLMQRSLPYLSLVLLILGVVPFFFRRKEIFSNPSK